jgi:two-component system chemotaxis response regulator CheB
MGILLTGMGRDGAKGMLSIRKSGGYTISQSEESCVIFGMPKAAIDIGAATKVCTISNISYEITHWDPQQKRYN